MEFLTKQQMFDKAAAGVIAQGGPSSVGEGRQCLYIKEQGDKTLHCGVGHLLANNEMRKAWDENGYIAGHLIGRACTEDDLRNSGIEPTVENDIFLGELQCAHDQANNSFVLDFMRAFVCKMREIADHYKLDASILDKEAK